VNNCIRLAKNADILICESAYSSKLAEKAKLYKHLTGQQAAMIAKNANAERLYLTHFSQRYKTVKEIEDDAKETFENTTCANDFMKVKL